MNAEVKQEWLRRLRSGEYTQGKARLKRQNPNGQVTHCCLGVLCDIAVERGVVDVKIGRFGLHHFIDDISTDVAVLPWKVQEWAGLAERGNRVYMGNTTLATLNDNGVSFEEIADLIENEL